MRRSLAGVSVVDPQKAWENSSRFATLDKRLVTPSAATVALDAAERALHDRVTHFFSAIRDAVSALYAGDVSAAVFRLIDVGEGYERIESHDQARECFERAIEASAPLPDRGAHVLALRRLGRTLLASSDFAGALRAYGRSAQVAHDSGDVEGEVIARTGEGNVLLRQGRPADAERAYRAALARIDAARAPEALALQRGQLRNNMVRATLRQSRFEEAEQWLAEARASWAAIDSPYDLMICNSVEGELREVQGQLEQCVTLYEQSHASAPNPSLQAIFAIDVAEVHSRLGHVEESFRWARLAEEQALTARSPDYLAHVYRGLGNVARDAGEMDGITFYEKALDIARERHLPYEEAETLVQYARLRERMGGTEEAVSFLERARAIYRELDAERKFSEAAELLARLSDPTEGGLKPAVV